MVGRECKWAFQTKKDNSSLDCIFRIVSELSPSFLPLFQVLIYDFTLLETAVYWQEDNNLGCMDHIPFGLGERTFSIFHLLHF